MEYVFEKAKASDLDAVMGNIKAVRAAGLTDWEEEYPAREHIEGDAAQGTLYVLRAGDGGLLASIAMYVDDAEFEKETATVQWTPAEKHASLFRLCVRADLHGRGLGAIAVARALDIARAQGCGAARLLASEAVPAANRLYQKLGFTCLGRVYLYEWWFNAYEKML